MLFQYNILYFFISFKEGGMNLCECKELKNDWQNQECQDKETEFSLFQDESDFILDPELYEERRKNLLKNSKKLMNV